MRFDTLARLSSQMRDSGSVADDELVEKAGERAGGQRARQSGVYRPSARALKEVVGIVSSKRRWVAWAVETAGI